MKLLVLNGPNINMLGIREPDIYGRTTYADLVEYIKSVCAREGIEVECLQSNHEGQLVDWIQDAYRRVDGIVMNPAAYTHTSVAILDALKAVGLPAVEIHISNIYEREEFRHRSVTAGACRGMICGLGKMSYVLAVEALLTR